MNVAVTLNKPATFQYYIYPTTQQLIPLSNGAAVAHSV
jgi:hypothetical protein